MCTPNQGYPETPDPVWEPTKNEMVTPEVPAYKEPPVYQVTDNITWQQAPPAPPRVPFNPMQTTNHPAKALSPPQTPLPPITHNSPREGQNMGGGLYATPEAFQSKKRSTRRAAPTSAPRPASIGTTPSSSTGSTGLNIPT